MTSNKFDPKRIKKLTDPKRIEFQDPELIWKKLDLEDPKVLVDIGAGTGFFAVPFCDRMNGGKVYACDSSQIMISWMKENIAPRYKNRIIPLKTEENRIDLENEIADLVYMINLHHELDNPLQLLKQAKRLLKPQGKIMIIDWKRVESPGGPALEMRVPGETIGEQLQQAGFEGIIHYHDLPYHSFLVATPTWKKSD